MPDHAVDPDLAARVERQLADTGYEVVVEVSDGGLVISGIVDSEEARQAVLDIARTADPHLRIDDELEVQSVLPTHVDRFLSEEPSAELADSPSELRSEGGEFDPDFTDQPLLRDPVAAVGDADTEDLVAAGDEVYTPPDDPVITTDLHGRTQVLGGFGTEPDLVRPDRSTLDGEPGDEALADAIRQELREDAATADLQIVVAVRNGVVHLRGQVSDLDDADNAEAVASRVPGIREVVEELEVANV
ncbi:MAG: BON domain-containing protein [Chloroflexota bacterium]|nr:BON domain-containing protein [Chloroflexota bacterium]